MLADIRYGADSQEVNNYIFTTSQDLLQGELPTLPGIYFSKWFRDFFDEILSKNSRKHEEKSISDEVQFSGRKFSL